MVRVHFKGDTLPVVEVSWDDCQEFCKKTGLSLPTEAQWEYACRAGTTGPYAGTGKLDDMGWFRENTEDKSHPVGQKKPNSFGLYDMHGNVWEWCADVYEKEFYSKPEATKKDPVCTSGSVERVIRGSSWFSVAGSCRSAHRDGFPPSLRFHVIGFRPSASLP